MALASIDLTLSESMERLTVIPAAGDDVVLGRSTGTGIPTGSRLVRRVETLERTVTSLQDTLQKTTDELEFVKEYLAQLMGSLAVQKFCHDDRLAHLERSCLGMDVPTAAAADPVFGDLITEAEEIELLE